MVSFEDFAIWVLTMDLFFHFFLHVALQTTLVIMKMEWPLSQDDQGQDDQGQDDTAKQVFECTSLILHPNVKAQQ